MAFKLSYSRRNFFEKPILCQIVRIVVAVVAAAPIALVIAVNILAQLCYEEKLHRVTRYGCIRLYVSTRVANTTTVCYPTPPNL